jgi:hypothetical protein
MITCGKFAKNLHTDPIYPPPIYPDAGGCAEEDEGQTVEEEAEGLCTEGTERTKGPEDGTTDRH